MAVESTVDGGYIRNITSARDGRSFTMGALGTDIKTNTDAVPKPRSLAMLSAIAILMSDDPKEEKQQQHQHQHQHETGSSAIPQIETLDSMMKSGLLERSVQLTRSLSRSLSTRDLKKTACTTASSPSSRKRKKKEHLQKDFFENGKRVRSLSSIPCALPVLQASSLVTNISKSSPMMLRNVKESSGTTSGTGTEPVTTGSSGASKSTFATTKSLTNATTTTSTRCPSNEICNNVYRSYQMVLPDSYAIGPILPKCNKTNSKDKIVDDYNYEVISSTLPLGGPPRLPCVKESFKIAERSREEKFNWGWYTK